MSAPAAQHPPDAELEPYRAILEHAELELHLAGEGEISALAAMAARWEALTRSLAPVPPAAAGPLLARALLTHERTHVELLRLQESLLADISTTVRATRTARGYAGNLRSRPRLDRSA